MATKRKARLAYLWDTFDWFERVAELALQAESFVAAEKMKSKAVQLRAEIDEIEQVRAARKRRRKVLSITDYYDELLDVVREIRIAAVAGGSCIAANQAVRQEAELLHAKGIALDAAAKAERDAKSIDDLKAEVERLRSKRGA